MFKRWTESRVWVLAVGAGAILALAALSAGLPNLRFAPPGAFVVEQGKPVRLGPQALPLEDPAWLERMLITLGVLSLILLGVILFNRKARQRFLKVLLYVALFFAVSTLIPSVPERPNTTATPVPSFGGLLGPSAAVPAYAPPQVSPLAAYLAALGLVLMAMAFGWYFWQRRRLAPTGHLLLPGLRQIAQSALDDLAVGRDWRDAVIRCYAQMTEAVATQRGLIRRPSTTAEEFAARLAEAGLPLRSVQRLTQLFESARYGSRHSSRAEAQEAAACLNEIVAAGPSKVVLLGATSGGTGSGVA